MHLKHKYITCSLFFCLLQLGKIKRLPELSDPPLLQALRYKKDGSDDMSDVIEIIDVIRTMDAGTQLECFTAKHVSTCERLRMAALISKKG